MVCGLLTFLITFVVPRFAQLYDQLGTKLPALTVFLLNLGQYAQHYGIYIALALAGVGFLGYRWMQTEAGAITVDKIRIGLPLFGNVWLKVPGWAVFADTLDAAYGRFAAGSIAWRLRRGRSTRSRLPRP